MNRDDDRLARASKALRTRHGLTQREVATSSRSREFAIRLEAGDAGSLRLGDIRDHFARLGASVRITAWWHGAELDQLIDARHAGLVERAIGEFAARGWRTEPEVTFSDYGERGSIDILAGNDRSRIAAVVEIKSEWGSLEHTNRALDIKERLAPAISVQRFGWRPLAVARLLVLPDDRSARRVAERHRMTLDAVYPARNREISGWLKAPSGPLRGLWFLPEVAPARPGGMANRSEAA